MQTSALPQISVSKEAEAADLTASARIAREIRIARIQKLHARAARNFKEAHFAYLVASSARDAAPKLNTERSLATKLCTRALRRMDHWCKRSYALARAEVQTTLRPISGGLHVC